MLVLYKDKDGKIKHLENDITHFFVVFKYSESQILKDNGVPSFWVVPATEEGDENTNEFNENLANFVDASIDYMYDSLREKFE